MDSIEKTGKTSLGGAKVYGNLCGRVSLIVLLAFGLVSSGMARTPALWSSKPVVRPEVPTGLSRSSNPIDAFIAAEHTARGLQPVGPADKRTLLRRVYLDLLGIPPTPAEQDAFLRDAAPDAYEKVVDRL